jgi:hypothetical protein
LLASHRSAVYSYSMSEENLLSIFPGELIARASRGLPPAELSKGEVREVEVDVPGRFRGRVIFKPFYFKRGKMSRWFWTAEAAVRIPL